MSKSCYYTVWVSFPFTGVQKDTEDMIDKLDEVTGVRHDGLGFGFGMADLDWYFENRREAEIAVKQIKRSPLFDPNTWKAGMRKYDKV